MKTFKELERIVRGFSNHRRIKILELIGKTPELSVEEISSILKINYKTAADHIRRLTIVGFLLKRSDSVSVRHKLTKRAEYILKFLRTLE